MTRTIVPLSRQEEPSGRVVCFGHAGAGTSCFARWRQVFPRGIELWAVRLPGRETRIREPPVTDIAAAVAECEPELELLSDRPLVLFGHCLGAYLAFELCGRLSARRLPVVGLVVSSQAAPHLELQSTAIRRDADLLQAVRAMGGTATEILEDAEARSLFLPVLRADFAVAESFTAREPVQLDVPIAAFAGRDDPVVASAEVAAWEEHTKQFSFHVREGGHFPSDDDWRRMADVVARQLAEPQAVATALGGRSS